ncbi:hypothetical protein D3C76_1356990 [compost metagenome]
MVTVTDLRPAFYPYLVCLFRLGITQSFGGKTATEPALPLLTHLDIAVLADMKIQCHFEEITPVPQHQAFLLPISRNVVNFIQTEVADLHQPLGF